MKKEQSDFLRDLVSWNGVATTSELRPQSSQVRQMCKRRGWVTFDKYYWRITDAGIAALRTASTRSGSEG